MVAELCQGHLQRTAQQTTKAAATEQQTSGTRQKPLSLNIGAASTQDYKARMVASPTAPPHHTKVLASTRRPERKPPTYDGKFPPLMNANTYSRHTWAYKTLFRSRPTRTHGQMGTTCQQPEVTIGAAATVCKQYQHEMGLITYQQQVCHTAWSKVEAAISPLTFSPTGPNGVTHTQQCFSITEDFP